MQLPQIKDLKKICQKGKFETHWYAKNITRRISIYVTWILLHTKITANAVSLLEIFVSWIGIFLLIIFGKPAIIPAIILIQLGYVFDCVDGEIARYKKQSSFLGVFHDSLGHILVTPTFYWGLAFFYYQQTYDIHILYLVAITSLFIISPIKHAKMRALYLSLCNEKPLYNFQYSTHYNYQEISKHSYIPYEEKSSKQKIIHLLKSATQLPSDMNIFCLALLLALILNNPFFVLIAVVTFSLITIIKEIIFYFKVRSENQIEKEYLKIKTNLTKYQ